LRYSLIKFFTFRGGADPEELADETIDRLIRKTAEVNISSNYIGNITAYALGVARNLWLENLANIKRLAPLGEFNDTEVGLSVGPEDDSRERLSDALQKALNDLSDVDRKLIRAYYETGRLDHEFRRGLAEQLGVSVNALRIKIHRLNERLRQSIEYYLSN
jgi:RNA polymerase sigma factor (sigma-70 family)